MISMMRVYGLFAGNIPGEDQKKGIKFQKISIIFEGGKKHVFKVIGRLSGFENVNFGDKITFDVDTPILKTFGEMSSYGDCMWECADMKLLQEKPLTMPLQKAA